jgi:predicted transcriptional regulator
VADQQSSDLKQLVAQVAASYFSNSHVSPAEIPNVIDQIASSLQKVGGEVRSAPADDGQPASRAKVTAAQISKSITPDALISFEDGRPYKTLRRHLSVKGLTPEQYREKWGLPRDYPIVAPSYSAQRSALAQKIGLGSKGRGGKPAKGATKGPARGGGRRKAAAT